MTEIDALRAQLAEAQAESNFWKRSSQTWASKYETLAESFQSHPNKPVIEQLEQQLAEAQAEIERRKREDFREMREMLRAMQAGELTVSRGIEILNMWWAGNWHDSMLPPVRHDLIEEDSMPVEIIDRLKAEIERLKREDFSHERVQNDSLKLALKVMEEQLAASQTKNKAMLDGLESVARALIILKDSFAERGARPVTPEKRALWDLAWSAFETLCKLALPNDNAALNAALAAVYEECAKVAAWQADGASAAIEIRALAKQRTQQ